MDIKDAWQVEEPTSRGSVLPPTSLPNPNGPNSGHLKLVTGTKGRGGRATATPSSMGGELAASQAVKEGGEWVKNTPSTLPLTPPLSLRAELCSESVAKSFTKVGAVPNPADQK